MSEESNRKRVSSRQLTDRDDVDDHVEAGDGGTWLKADAGTMQKRKIAKVRGKPSETPASEVATPSPPTDSAPTPKFSFATYKPEEKKEETKPATPEKVPQETTNGTPAKEATPVKEAVTTPAEATPTKEAPVTPSKEATPAKETPTEGESKEATPAKDSTPAKAEGTPEAPKPFTLPTSFSFPTSFSSASFSFLSSTTTPAFSTTTTPAFSGFNFPTTNFSAGGGSSVFSAGGAKKEGSDDEGDEANPEEEVAITGPNTLPIVQTLTGEEEETTLFTVRAKLFALLDAKWQERGVGQLKLNKDKDGKCRLLMRDQGGKHLRLNTFLFPEMKVDKTADKSVQFVAIGNGGAEGSTTSKPFTTFALRVARAEEATELLEALNKHKATAPTSSSSSSSSTSTTTTSDST